MTEYMGITLGTDIDDEYVPDNLGQLSPGNEVKIVDLSTGESLGVGMNGEVCVRGNRMFSGYLNNDSANKEAFDGEGWLRTGDIGHYDHKERLFITGRLKGIFDVYFDNKCQRFSAEKIEDFLLTHKSIADVVVIGVKNRIAFQSPRAYVKLINDGQVVTDEDIQEFVSGLK